MSYDVLCMGRSSIDLYAHEMGVPITEVKSFDAYVGGCPTNVSVGTRRLGLRSTLLTAVGTDQVGDFVLNFLDREGVDTRFIPRFPERRTSAALLTIQPPDRFPLTFYRENCADLGLDVRHVDAAPIEAARVVFLTGTGLSGEPSRTATLYAAERARALGRAVFVDIDFRPGLWDSTTAFATNVRALLAHADVVIGTEEEWTAATGESDAVAGAQRLLGTSLQASIVKCGSRGAVACADGVDPALVAPFRVDVMNVLGAGDAFASGFIYGWTRGWPLTDAVRLGNAVGAMVVARHGCANSMPTLPEVHAFVAADGWSLPS